MPGFSSIPSISSLSVSHLETEKLLAYPHEIYIQQFAHKEAQQVYCRQQSILASSYGNISNEDKDNVVLNQRKYNLYEKDTTVI
jgi:hypothetical protein